MFLAFACKTKIKRINTNMPRERKMEKNAKIFFLLTINFALWQTIAVKCFSSRLNVMRWAELRQHYLCSNNNNGGKKNKRAREKKNCIIKSRFYTTSFHCCWRAFFSYPPHLCANNVNEDCDWTEHIVISFINIINRRNPINFLL